MRACQFLFLLVPNPQTNRSSLSPLIAHQPLHPLFANRSPLHHRLPDDSSATSRVIAAKDHASIQIAIAHVDEKGFATGASIPIAICGQIRKMVSLFSIFCALFRFSVCLEEGFFFESDFSVSVQSDCHPKKIAIDFDRSSPPNQFQLADHRLNPPQTNPI